MLKKLEKRSNLEESREIDVNHDERMLAITKETGQFFNILLKSMNAKKILEVGMSVGYSTIWFAEAVSKNDGKIITIEQNPVKISRAKSNFKEAGVERFIEIRQGEAIQILRHLSENIKKDQLFDFVFLDADKELNIEYFDLVLPMVKIGGIIATDNILYPERFRPMMQKFVEHVKTTANVQTATLDLGNGEQVSLRIF